MTRVPVRSHAPSDALRAPRTAPVPGGVFVMGSDRGRPDERPRRTARVEGFELGVTPVTCAEYDAYLTETGAEPPPSLAQPDFNHPEQPITGVTWFEACAYAEWLARRFGGRWRLPDEAEWERAARAGCESDEPSGVPDEIPVGPLRGPWRVARGRPNAYGCYDLGTIVHEWCRDWYAPPAESEGGRRSSRGGSWRHHVRWSPPSARSSLPPSFRYSDYGFRVLREVP
jgi:formylglycine-generating enzyme required for sulfatase activity